VTVFRSESEKKGWSVDCMMEVGKSRRTGVFSVGDRVLDDTLQEDLEDTSGLFVDQTGDSPERKRLARC
jgi:hypothetical protein